MTSFTKTKALRLFAVLAVWVCSVAAIFGQGSTNSSSQKPLLQQITVQNQKPTVNPTPAATPGVKTIGSSSAVSTINTSIPVLKDVSIPGYSGILVESLDNKIVMENLSSLNYNPASNVKIATSYAVLKTFGTEFRFPTSVWTDGSFDPTSGTLYGNLYISGKDPSFNLEHGVAISNELNRLGIRNVTGDLVVTDNFVMAYSTSPQRAASALFATLDGAKRTASINKA